MTSAAAKKIVNNSENKSEHKNNIEGKVYYQSLSTLSSKKMDIKIRHKKVRKNINQENASISEEKNRNNSVENMIEVG